jgi:hypothetical protein
LRTRIAHRENSWQENAVLPENNPLGLGRIKSIGEKRMTIRIMHEDHHRTPALELGLFRFIQKD